MPACDPCEISFQTMLYLLCLDFNMIVIDSCFFMQVDFSVTGRDFKLTLIARRSRHYAGTRFDIILLPKNNVLYKI